MYHCFLRSETPQQKAKNIKKLKAFFGERTPKIVEAQQRAGGGETTSTTAPPASPIGDVAMEGVLNYKIAVTDHKVHITKN